MGETRHRGDCAIFRAARNSEFVELDSGGTARESRFSWVGSLELAVTLNVWLSFAGPALMPLNETVCWAASSRIVWFVIGAKVGASFTAVTVTVKVLVVKLTPPLAIPPLSLTKTEIVAVPLMLATGV